MKQVSDEFAIAFGEQPELLVQHDFVALVQSSYLKELKGKLRPGEAAIFGDFAESYSMITQDEIPITPFE